MTGILNYFRPPHFGGRSRRRAKRRPSNRYRRLALESMEQRVVLSAAPLVELPGDTIRFDLGDFKVVGADEFMESSVVFSTASLFNLSIDTIRLNLVEVNVDGPGGFINVGDVLYTTSADLANTRGLVEWDSAFHNFLVPLSRLGTIDTGFGYSVGEGFTRNELPFRLIPMPAPPNDLGDGGIIDIAPIPKSPIPDPGPSKDTGPAGSLAESLQNTQVEQSHSRAIIGTSGAHDIRAARGRVLAIEVALAENRIKPDATEFDTSGDTFRPRGSGRSLEGELGRPLELQDGHVLRLDGHGTILPARGTAEESEAGIDPTRSTLQSHDAIEPRTSAARGAERPDRGSLPTSPLREDRAATDDFQRNRDVPPIGDEQALARQLEARAIAFAQWDDAADGDIQRASVPLRIENQSRQPITWALVALASTGGVLYARRSRKLHESEQLPPRRRRGVFGRPFTFRP